MHYEREGWVVLFLHLGLHAVELSSTSTASLRVSTSQSLSGMPTQTAAAVVFTLAPTPDI